VCGSGLTDAVDAADPLLQPHRIPRQLEAHHPSRPMLKVESLRCDVRRKQDRRLTAEKLIERVSSFGGCLTTVQRDQVSRPCKMPFDRDQRMSELREVTRGSQCETPDAALSRSCFRARPLRLRAAAAGEATDVLPSSRGRCPQSRPA
jgi:hypothetical protein